MAGDVEPERGLFRGKHLNGRPAFCRRRNLIAVVVLLRKSAEQSALSLNAIALGTLRPREGCVDGVVQGAAPLVDGPAIFKRVESAGAYEAFKHALVQSGGVNPFGKVKERLERS